MVSYRVVQRVVSRGDITTTDYLIEQKRWWFPVWRYRRKWIAPSPANMTKVLMTFGTRGEALDHIQWLTAKAQNIYETTRCTVVSEVING
jgi:hypothetical protein